MQTPQPAAALSPPVFSPEEGCKAGCWRCGPSAGKAAAEPRQSRQRTRTHARTFARCSCRPSGWEGANLELAPSEGAPFKFAEESGEHERRNKKSRPTTVQRRRGPARLLSLASDEREGRTSSGKHVLLDGREARVLLHAIRAIRVVPLACRSRLVHVLDVPVA